MSTAHTTEKLFTGVNDTADKFFASVNDTGDKTVLTIPAFLDLKMKNKQKFNLTIESVLKYALIKKIPQNFFSFIAGVIDTAEKLSFAKISASFRKKSKRSKLDS